MNKKRANQPKQKHYFFLNPYADCAFTKCPKCDAKTKIRKFPLVIHIEPKQVLLLNKKCKYCTDCDLIIVKQKQLESLMAAQFHRVDPEIVGNQYLVMGTLERRDWKQGNQGSLTSQEIIDRMYLFQDYWDFEVIPGGWYVDED